MPSPATALAGLPDDPALLKQIIAELFRELHQLRRDQAALQHRLDALLRRRSDLPPEPAPPVPSPLAAAGLPPALVVPPPAAPPKKARPHGRRRPSAALRCEARRYELTVAERLCPACGRQRQEIGVEVTQQYDYQPAEVFVVEHQRVKYACRQCQEQVVIAPKPAQPIDRGLPGPGLLAQILMDKYQDHLPLYRTEQRFARLGVTLPRSTLCDWMAACATLLTPLYQLLVQLVLASKAVHTDDTTVPVQDPSQPKLRTGRLWVYLGDAEHPGVVFDYTATHARDGPTTFLKHFQGYLQADAYGGYDGIYTGSQGAIVEVACWAHVRHKFHDAQGTDPERALAAKAWIRKLYDVEDAGQELPPAERQRLRQARAVPLLTSLRQWLLVQQADVLPKSPIAAAINYTLNQWEALQRYTTDGDLHIDNNRSERTLKLIGIGRRNWLFVGSDTGGQTAAVLFSFTATCKHLGIDTFAYLREVLTRLPTHPPDRLAELLPHRWQALRQAAANHPESPAPP
jgi:transposase